MDQALPSIEILSPNELRAGALRCLQETSPVAKCAAVKALHADWHAGRLALGARPGQGAAPSGIPGRPAAPELVSPKLVKSRSMRTPEGRVALVHALAHIEFNAINLALDAVWRFDGMPQQFHVDWLQVATEEAYHFSLLAAHLAVLGHAYGDFAAHNSLWEMCEKTNADVLARMALVPRTMEARGLDAAPPVRAKLAQAGDLAAAQILDIIMRDEIGHVLIGNRWFGWLCVQRGIDPITSFAELASRYQAPVMRGPFNLDARRAAGFSEEELLVLMDIGP